MDNSEVLRQFPHLISPAALAVADSQGRWKAVPHLRYTNDVLVRAWKTPNSRTAVIFPFQHGKLISHNTPVLTVEGWKKHGDLQVGDRVFSAEGKPVRVEAVSSEGLADHEVEFTDGSSVRCHGRHEWFVMDRRRRRWEVLETQEMMKRPIREVYGSSRRYLFQLPRANSLEMPQNDRLPVDPYVLGAWLGDGRSEAGQLSRHRDDTGVFDAIIGRGYPITSSWVQEDTKVHYAHFTGLVTALRAAGVLGNKHIPDEYLLGSELQRAELLAGLIDTDGNYSEKSGQYRFTNTNKRLIDGVAVLARTLGMKPGVVQEYEPITSSSGIEGKKTVYVLAFQATRFLPCQLGRKQPRKIKEACNLAIAAIRPYEPTPGKCIQVEGGMYLVGESLIPTHNSLLCSVYFPAWVLLRAPTTRIGLASYEEGFASGFGARVREIVARYGPAFGINLREDTQAKGEWVVDKFGGGMVCKGRGGALVGRPVDLLILDDMIKNAEEAQSPTILDGLWDWYCTVAYSRLGPIAPVVAVGTRWGPKDLFGRFEAEAKVGGDEFQTVIFRAIAGSGDILGRKPGEALWPERVPLARLQKVQKLRPRWFRACWQGEPEEQAGLHYQPRQWPKFVDVGDAWRVQVGIEWRHYRKLDCTLVIAVDWAQAGKKGSDHTAIVTSAITPDGLVLVLGVFCERLRYEENAPALAAACREARLAIARGVLASSGGLVSPYTYLQGGGGHGDVVRLTDLIVASDDDTLSDAMVVECARHEGIPAIKRLAIRSRAKIVRAQAAIIRSQNRLFLLPDPERDWYEVVCDQLASFTGVEGAEDDIADCFGILGRVADEFQSGELAEEENLPQLGSGGYPGAGGW